MPQTIPVADFGRTNEGHPVYRYTLANKNGLEANVINYGATLVSLRVPGTAESIADIVLGYDTVQDYERGEFFFGGTIGRYANRVAHGRFKLNGTIFHLSINDGPNSLHGGRQGFHKKLWSAVDRSGSDAQALELSYTSLDFEEGYPGKLNVKVTYTLPAERNELRIDYWANTDRATIVNFTNHSYFNLTGDMSHTILDHRLRIRADEFTPVDSTMIPTGELREVIGTPFDFTRFHPIGARIGQADTQLKLGRGYDHNWVLQSAIEPGPTLAAELFEPTSGRLLEVLTTEPGVQFYSGNFLDGTTRGKNRQVYGHRVGLCLETQHFPDSPNHVNFPSTVLNPDQNFESTTLFRFSARRREDE